jgi:hypothetical protein
MLFLDFLCTDIKNYFKKIKNKKIKKKIKSIITTLTDTNLTYLR